MTAAATTDHLAAVRDRCAELATARTTETDANEALNTAIREASAAGVTATALAAASGLSRQRVWQILKNTR